MKRVLKKVTAALLAATMVVGLAACGNGGSSDDKSSKSSKSGKVKSEFLSGLQQTFLDHSVRRSLMKQQKLLMSKYSMLTRDMYLRKLQLL